MARHSRLFVRGLEEMRHHFGEKADQLVARVSGISEEFGKLNVEVPYGELYTRAVLDERVRELCTVAALTVMGHALPQLRLHVEGALNCGATKEEVVEVIMQMIAYGGFPSATNALLTAKEAFDDWDANGASQTSRSV
jgi:4-carboxymuconolactone decarboxylase